MNETEAKLTQVRAILSEWAQKQGHAKCWNHNEILERLASVLAVEQVESEEYALPCKEEFQLGCIAYWDFLYGNPPQSETPGVAYGCVAILDLRRLAQALHDNHGQLRAYELADVTQPEWFNLLCKLAPQAVPSGTTLESLTPPEAK